MHNGIRIFLFHLLVLLMPFTFCSGQVNKAGVTHRYTKLPKAKGLFADAAVGCAVEDKAGNVWMGTNGEGLFRYDRNSFTQFTEKDGLDNLIIYSLLQDKTGHIWIGTKSGLCRYD